MSSSSSGAPDPGSSGIMNSGHGGGPDIGTAARLKAQMQADAPRPLNTVVVGSDEGEDGERPLRIGTGVDSDREDPIETIPVWPEEALLQVRDHLRLSVSRSLRFPSPSPTIDLVSNRHTCAFTPYYHLLVWTIGCRTRNIHRSYTRIFGSGLTHLLITLRHPNDWNRS